MNSSVKSDAASPQTSDTRLTGPEGSNSELTFLNLMGKHGGSPDTNTITVDAQPSNNAAVDGLPKVQVSGSDRPQFLAPSDYIQQFQMPVNGSNKSTTREFEVHLPKGYDGTSSLPVIYMFHGLTENMDMMKQYSQMNAEADAKHFAVVYLQAEKQPFPTPIGTFSENSWNMDHGTLTPKDPTYDDLDYFKKVKTMVEGELPIDKSRQYLAGFSEGGEAAQYIAHEMPHTFAGVATVHSTILDTDPRPRSEDPTAMISILGDDDNILPINGGHGWFSQYSLLKGYMGLFIPNVDKSQPLAQASAWANANGDTVATTISDGQQVTTKFSGGAAPVEQIVRHSRFFGGGGQHAWDGGHDGWAAQPNPDFVQSISRAVRSSDPLFDASGAVVDFLLPNTK